jgi:mutator protein MutT
LYSPASQSPAKKVEVVAALLVNGDQVLVAQRKASDSGAGFWEFPGGKVEKGETHEEALRREIQEELEMPIRVLNKLDSQSLITPTQKLIQLTLFAAIVEDRHYVLNDHDDARWVSWKDLKKVPLMQGNIKFLPAIENFFHSYQSKK